CAMKADRQVFCVGHNDTGILTIPEGIQFQSISGGYKHACGIILSATSGSLGGDSLACWGDDRYQQRDVPSSLTAASIAVSNKRIVQITAGWTHTCALLNDGTVSCFG